MTDIDNAIAAISAMTATEDSNEQELQATIAINNILNSLQGFGAYNTIASSLASFTAVQPVPWQALSHVIQGVLQGWQALALQHQEQIKVLDEAIQATKH